MKTPKFVILTDLNGKEILVNTSQIILIEPDSDYTKITLAIARNNELRPKKIDVKQTFDFFKKVLQAT